MSVLDDPEVHCLSGAPCSGTYSPNGLSQGIGACPSSTGCALLPNNEAVMGCVAAGRGDVAYVNADGSLTRGGKVINLQAATDASSTAPATTTTTGVTTAPTTTTTTITATTMPTGTTTTGTAITGSTATTPAGSTTPTATTPAGTVAAGNLDGKDPVEAGKTSAIGSQDASASAGSKKGSSSSTTAGSTAGLRGSRSSSGSSASVPSPTPTPLQSVSNINSQQTLADIDGDTKTNQGKVTSAFGITSLIGIVVGCLAIVAIVAGVRLLKKGKEDTVETPEGALDAYGGGITPKENVVLL